MFRSRFLWKLFAGYGVVLLLAMAFLGEKATDTARSSAEASVYQLLERAARVSAYLEGGIGDAELARKSHIRFVWLDAKGREILPGGLGQDQRSTAAFQNAAVDGVGRSVHDGPDGATFSVVVAVGERKDASYLLAETTLLAFDAASDGVADTVLIGILLALGVFLLLSVLFAQSVVRPLGRMDNAVNAMSEGDFERRLVVDEGDEIGQLSESLNQLALKSRERMDMMTTDRNKVLAILGAMVEGVVAVDLSERIVHMNAAAARILGTRAANTEGRRVWEVTRVREVNEILRSTLEQSSELSGEMRVVVPPRDRWVELRAAPLLDAEDSIAGAVVMLNDVTDLRRLEAIRRDFVANVSHELKTPIAAIRGLVETVLDDGDEMPSDTRRGFLSKIRSQSFRLSSLVTDLLTLSRLESGGEFGEMALLDLRRAISDSVAALHELAESRRIEVELELPDRSVQVVGDLESLRLVVSNLLNNALKYTPEGGRVRLHLDVNESTARLEVQDNGIGIEPKHQDRIFQRFYRVDKARSRELGGTGLGLSIVKHVCMAHSGDVGVESAPGRGSSFFVRLPLA